jgi:hypothetical protein
MFLGMLLLVFFLIPILLIAVALAAPMGARLWFLFVAFPTGLILFTLWRHLAAAQKARRGGEGGDR